MTKDLVFDFYRSAEPVEARLVDKRPLRLPTYGSRSGQASTGSGLRCFFDSKLLK